MWLSCTRMTVCCFHYQDLDVLSVCLTVPTIASDLVRPKLHCCMFYSVMVFGIVTKLKHLALNCFKYISYSKTFLLLALNSSIFALYCGTCLTWLIFFKPLCSDDVFMSAVCLFCFQDFGDTSHQWLPNRLWSVAPQEVARAPYWPGCSKSSPTVSPSASHVRLMAL